MKKVTKFLKANSVPIMFIIICSICIPISGLSATYIIGEVLTRLTKNAFLILSLLIPIMAGLGLNFGITLGAMAGEIALVLVSDWQIWGISAIVLSCIISIPLSALLGWFAGKMLNLAKSREMVTSYILSYFINGLYTILMLYVMGTIIPIKHFSIKLPRGYGIRSSVNMTNNRQCIDNALSFVVGGVKIPVLTLILIVLMCLFIVWFKKTKLGQDMRAVGQDMEVARSAGIDVERTRIIAMVISTIMAGFGMIMYIQNLSSFATYTSHANVGMFAIAALLIGGASVDKASIGNVFVGVVLFHTLFIMAPTVFSKLTGSPIIGEYSRVFVSYAVIALALIMYEMKKRKQKSHSEELAANQKKEGK